MTDQHKTPPADDRAALRRLLDAERVDVASLRLVEDAIEGGPRSSLELLRVASLLRKLQQALADV